MVSPLTVSVADFHGRPPPPMLCDASSSSPDAEHADTLAGTESTTRGRSGSVVADVDSSSATSGFGSCCNNCLHRIPLVVVEVGRMTMAAEGVVGHRPQVSSISAAAAAPVETTAIEQGARNSKEEEEELPDIDED